MPVVLLLTRATMKVKLFIAVGVVLFLALIVLMLNPSPLPEPRSIKQAPDNWHTPQFAAIGSDAALSAINATGLWGAATATQGVAAPAIEYALTPPDWRISSVYITGTQRVVVLATAGAPDRILKVGDALPGGAKILAISTDQICFSLNGKRSSLSTYPQ